MRTTLVSFPLNLNKPLYEAIVRAAVDGGIDVGTFCENVCLERLRQRAQDIAGTTSEDILVVLAYDTNSDIELEVVVMDRFLSELAQVSGRRDVPIEAMLSTTCRNALGIKVGVRPNRMAS